MTLRLDAADRAELNRLMIRLADGDRAAFQPIFAALWPRMRSWSIRLMMNTSEGEDAAQQALLKLFAQADRFDVEGDVFAWGLTLATWECKTLQRQNARRAGKLLAEPMLNSSPEQHVIEADLLNAIEELVDELSPGDQALLRLSPSTDQLPQTPTTRKKKERALAKLKAMWRKRHG